MRWVAIFEDDGAADWVRKQHSAEHFDYLARHRDRIVLGEAAALCEQDPYFRRGLRKGYRLYTWGKAPAYGAVTL